MRIAHIEAGRHLYGGAAQVCLLTRALARAGHENVLICARDAALAREAHLAHAVELPMRGELDVALLPRLVRELKRAQPDLVHVHSRRGADLYGGAAAALARIPAVITRRVDAAEPAIFARLKYRPYGAVVALSRAIERQLLAAGVARERIALIASAVDTERYRPAAAARERLRTELGVPASALVVGVVAQLIERKRHSWLFGILPPLMRAHPELRVACFGRGPLEQRLERELVERGLADRVALTGFRSDLDELLPGLDVLAHPADREGLGLALVEAASAGVPAVACSVGGVPDVVVDGVTGVLVPRDEASAFGRALGDLLASADERRRLGAAARRHAERCFDSVRLGTEHLSLYARVLREHGAHVPAAVPK